MDLGQWNKKKREIIALPTAHWLAYSRHREAMGGTVRRAPGGTQGICHQLPVGSSLSALAECGVPQNPDGQRNVTVMINA